MGQKIAPTIPLPKGWQRHVRSAVLHVISLAQYAAVYTRGWAVDSMNGRVRLKAERDRLLQELALEREASRIKDARMARMAALRRPHYLPSERMAILELRAARGWSLQQTADTLLVSPETIASWMKRVDEKGPDALLELHEPVNRFPDLVRYLVSGSSYSARRWERSRWPKRSPVRAYTWANLPWVGSSKRSPQRHRRRMPKRIPAAW